MKILTFSILFFSLAGVCTLRAQAPNDDIENSIFLQLDQPHQSKTDGCTVQQNCVDESLTGKCIDYHNDQWFTFNSGNYTRLYINIIGQYCRDLKGVQIVVLKGEPCQVDTYEILTCVSLANQDDIYVELDSLSTNQQYFINIDGYLHDFCSFNIEVSANARGLPPEQSLDLVTNASRKDHLVRIDWEMPDSLKHQIVSFQVFRRIHPDFSSSFVDEIFLGSNAYGEVQTDYYFEDSIASGKTYYYKLAAKQVDGKLLLINDFKFRYKKISKQPKFVRFVRIPLEDVKNKDSITIIIIDSKTSKIIKSEVFNYHKKGPKYINYRTYPAIQRGAYHLKVKVINNTTKMTKEYAYDLWDD